MKYKTLELSPNELYLDIQNPRFIVSPGGTQEDIISYLLESEDIINLCKGINSNKDLVIGERVVAYLDDGKYIVGEGNRRTCACKLLLNPNLAPEDIRDKIPKVSNETKKNISKIQVDIAKNRDEAMASMGAKHIAGIKKWSTYAKMKYFFDQFNSGKSIKFISEITLTSTQKVIQQIKFYNLLLYAKNINYFSPLERDKLFNFSDPNIKVSIFTKALTFSYKEGPFKDQSISSLLQMEYDSKNYRVKSTLPKTVFDKSLYIISKNSLDPNSSFNTRSKIDDLKDLSQLLIDYTKNPEKYSDLDIDLSENTQLELPISEENSINNIEVSTPSESFKTPSESLVPKSNTNNKLDGQLNFKEQNIIEINSSTSDQINKQPSIDLADTSSGKIFETKSKENIKDINTDLRPSVKMNERPSLPNFFSTLTWSTLDANNPENAGLISLCSEIQRISQKNHYKQYPISATILARALFEQTLLYYLKKDPVKYNSLTKRNNYKVPPLEKVISFTKTNIDNLIKDDQLKRCFKAFADSTGNKDYFDMVIHNPHLVVADPNMLDTIANNGLKGFIHLILNS